MLPMEDLSAIPETSTFSMANGQRKISRQLPRSPSERRKNHRIGKEGSKNDGGNDKNVHLNGFSRDQIDQNEQMKRERNHQGGHSSKKIVENGQMMKRKENEESRGIHLLDLGPTNPSIESKMQIAIGQLGRAMSAKSNSQVKSINKFG